MAGIALLLPEEEMCRQARKMIDSGENHGENHIIYIKQTKIDNVVLETKKAVAMGANIVVARGSQAYEVKINTNIPVVEIMLTARELGLAIVKAKRIVKKENPLIGIFFWKGMLCDTEDLDELFGVRILQKDLDREHSWHEMIDRAAAEGIDFLISGEMCARYANEKGIPAMVFHTTQEALRLAVRSAEKLYRMSLIERQNYAQFISVLDSAFNGIIKTSDEGRILLMNRVMEQILDIRPEKVLGEYIVDVLEGLDREIFERVLKGAMDNYSTFINTKNQALVVVIEPIVVDGIITGTIVSCNKMKRMNWNQGENVQEQFLRGLTARGNLDELTAKRPSLKAAVDAAKIYAQSSSPILVVGKTGQEMEELCQGIHNYSLRKGGPFVVINMAGIEEQDQMRILFGEGEKSGILIQANYGTLVIRAIDKLTLNAQYRLLQAIRQKRLSISTIDNDYIQELDIRIIGCTSKRLQEVLKSGKFRKDLYYLLQTFRLAVPDFSDRKEDVRVLVGEHMKKYMNLYARYHILTEEARDILVNYNWEGNDIQLEAFCERLVLTAGRRKISGEYVKYLLDDLYHGKDVENALPAAEPEGNVGNTELERLKEALANYNGNRILTAKALNISTSTLWRRMKKYRLE